MTKGIIFLVGVYFLLSIIKLEHPGVNNDQLMFVNAATFNPEGKFVWKEWHGLPLMIFPYIGALKSYLFMPIFHFFGVNIWSIRLPNILITAVSLLLLYQLVGNVFRKSIGFLTVIFLAIDSSFIAYFRIDTGPNVLEFFLKVLALYFFFLAIRHKNILFALSVLPFLALGIFNKLNFIWFVNAFMLAQIIFYGRQIFSKLKTRQKILAASFFIISYSLLLKLFFKMSNEVLLSYKSSSEISLSSLGTNFVAFSQSLAALVNGNFFFNIVYGFNPTPFGAYFSMLFFATIVVGLWLGFKKKIFDKNLRRSCLFFLTLLLVLILHILLTKRATQPWHTLAVYPFIHLLFALGLYSIFIYLKKLFAKLTFLGLVVLMGAYLLSVNAIYLNHYSAPTKLIAYSSSIYALIDYTKQTSMKFVCLDVDICNQLLSLAQKQNKYFEPLSFFDRDTFAYTFSMMLEKFNQPKDYLYITHANNNSYSLEFKQAFFDYLKRGDINYTKMREFKDGSNLVFEVYKVGYF